MLLLLYVAVTHLLLDSHHIQLSDLVVKTVLEHTNSVLLLLEMLLNGGDLKWPHVLDHTRAQSTKYKVVSAHCGIPWREVYPSLPSAQCPWCEAGHTT